MDYYAAIKRNEMESFVMMRMVSESVIQIEVRKKNSVYYTIYIYNTYIYICRRKQWHPTPVLLPGESHRWRSLVGCSPWGRQESDTTELLRFHFSLYALEKEMTTHSSVLAWRISGTGEPGGCRLWGLTESDTTEVT